jgi:hypothetical protein
MKRETIENILASEEPLVPASGFLASVIERVEEEALAPAPIPFPWQRIAPGVVLIAGALGWVVIDLARHGIPPVQEASVVLGQIPAVAAQPLEQAGWVALALGISLFSWLLSRHLADRTGLL